MVDGMKIALEIETWIIADWKFYWKSAQFNMVDGTSIPIIGPQCLQSVKLFLLLDLKPFWEPAILAVIP